jgi:hypothetical protein
MYTNGDLFAPGLPIEDGPNRQRVIRQWWEFPRNWVTFPLESSYGNDSPLIVTYEQSLTVNVEPEASTAAPVFAASIEIPDVDEPFFPVIWKEPL